MLIRSFSILAALVLLSACAHRGAVKVDCEGPLRAINRTEPVPPVTVEPSGNELPKPPESQP
jgi:hypothetical protein